MFGPRQADGIKGIRPKVMCGFVAVINSKSRSVDGALLSAMANRIAHRGPDAEGHWTQGNVGFYHKRLAIIDIESGDQPMTRDNVTVAFNGEIYNYIELRDELRSQGEEFETSSDTEVLLLGYLHWGADFVQRLNGMFAFVIFDGRCNRLLAARDHFGIKPLYRYLSDGCLIYGSEIKAILAHPDVTASLDSEALSDYITLQHTLGRKTFFAGIERLEPSTFEIVDVNQLKQPVSRRYWKPDYTIDGSLTELDAVDQLSAMIKNSVRLQLRSDVPLGAYVSGGTDSSTVALLAADGYGERLETFTGAFHEGDEFDETRYAAAVSEQAGARQHLVYPTERDFTDSLEFLSYSMDEPAAGPGLFPQYCVSKLASENVKVCLGGQGGDEIYGGYARHAIAYLEFALRAAISGEDSGADGIRLDEFASQLPLLQQYIPMLKRQFSNGLFEAPDLRYFQLLDRSAGVLDAFSSDVRDSYDKELVFQKFSAIFNDSESESLFNRVTYFDMMASLPALLQVEDRVSMAVSLESRVPLLDPDVMNFVASIPPRIKWKHGELKYLFKQAVKKWLPQSIIERKDKMGFPVPLHLWAQGNSRDFFCDILLSQRCRERGLFDAAKVEQLISEEAAFGRGLWGLLQIELWHRNFVDGASNYTHEGDTYATVI
jgi:asparagine synthase (glutamine-hydrolysing)